MSPPDFFTTLRGVFVVQQRVEQVLHRHQIVAAALGFPQGQRQCDFHLGADFHSSSPSSAGSAVTLQRVAVLLGVRHHLLALDSAMSRVNTPTMP